MAKSGYGWKMMVRISRTVIFLLIAAALISAGCFDAGNEPTVPISIEIYGSSVNPVDIAWTIHNNSGTVSNLTLDYTSSEPYVIQRNVPEDEFDTVSMAITDSGTTGNLLITSGNCTVAPSGSGIKTITVDFDTHPVGSSNYIFEKGDFIRDFSLQDFYISNDPVADGLANGEIVIYDDEDQYAGVGACSLYASNRSAVTVNFIRNGSRLDSCTGSTITEAVNMAYGSAAW